MRLAFKGGRVVTERSEATYRDLAGISIRSLTSFAGYSMSLGRLGGAGSAGRVAGTRGLFRVVVWPVRVAFQGGRVVTERSEAAYRDLACISIRSLTSFAGYSMSLGCSGGAGFAGRRPMSLGRFGGAGFGPGLAWPFRVVVWPVRVAFQGGRVVTERSEATYRDLAGISIRSLTSFAGYSMSLGRLGGAGSAGRVAGTRGLFRVVVWPVRVAFQGGRVVTERSEATYRDLACISIRSLTSFAGYSMSLPGVLRWAWVCRPGRR